MTGRLRLRRPPLGKPGVDDDAIEAGLRMIGERDFSFVLMDLRMNGLTAIRRIRARSDRKATLPIIVIIADAGVTLHDACVAEGAGDVLSKPVSMQDLFDAMGRILARQSPVVALI